MRWLRRSVRLALAGAGFVGMTACAGAGSWDLAGRSGLLLPIKQYYEASALEQGGRCRAPELKGVASSEVVAEQGGTLEVRVRYFFRDYVNDLPGQCKGFGERVFTVAERDGAFVVQGMTGAQGG